MTDSSEGQKPPPFPRRFGKYHLLSPLAQGGMGALYLAVTGDRGLERLLVIKTVLPHLADDEYVARFRDEAKVVVQLSHQNLIPVFDAGLVDGELFLAMDFVEGKDLRAIWNRCAQKSVAFPVDVAAFVVKELCRGLAYAHSSRDLELVHRDVSPPNVLLSYAGEVKLTDFGLAASTLKLEKTAPGIVYGKVSYMSPEQARGDKLDGRSDLYAAGIILWELLTGRQLFPASSDQGKDLLDRSKDPEVPAPSSRAPRVPAALDAICAKALAPRPEDRYQNGEEFREALGTWLAKTHPATDAARVERFLEGLFHEDIIAERSHRKELIRQTRERVATLPPTNELRLLFDSFGEEYSDRRQDEGPNLGRRAVDSGVSPRDRRRQAGRRAADKLAEGVGTMLGIQPSGRSPASSGAQAAAAEAEVLLENPKPEASRVLGEVLDGRYRVSELIGEGGMGRVYLAEHIEIGRRVAVKILHKVYNHMPDLVERFRREARAASRIGHPNIVDVTDSGTTDDGSTYFVMEYLEGVELASVIDREGALEVGRSLIIAMQICRALAAAHAVNIIHRDLKPENVYLTESHGASDFVKILDFGIAKSGGAEEAREKRLTSPGVAMGTPEYMAPEQAAGKPADERCDIYAVGAILYEMLGGIPPYDGENFMEILSKKATAEPAPLASLREDLPLEVVELVESAMARDPEDRPSSMEAFEYELTKLTSGRGAAVARVLGLSAEASDSPSSNPPLGSGPVAIPMAPFAFEEESISRRRSSQRMAASAPAPDDGAIEPREVVATPRRAGSRVAWVGGLSFLALSLVALIYVVSSEPGPEGVQTSVGKALDSAPAPDRRQGAAPEEPADAGVARPKKVGQTASSAGNSSNGAAGRPSEPAPLNKVPKSAKQARALLEAAASEVAAQKFAAAQAKYRLVIRGAHARAQGYLGLANIAFQKESFDRAIQYARRAGASPDALMMIGNAYFRKGDCGRAVAAYRKVEKTDPKNKAARKGVERCQR